MPKILIPSFLIKYTNNSNILSLNCKTLNEIGYYLQKEYPDLFKILYSNIYRLKNFACIYLNQQLVKNFDTNILLGDNDTLEIVIAIAGG